jgi:excisionase family DNA binding protein
MSYGNLRVVCRQRKEDGGDMSRVERFINVGDVAEMFGLSVATIRKWVFLGYIPYKKIGRAVRFSTTEIEDWARSKSVGSVQPPAQEHEGGSE